LTFALRLLRWIGLAFRPSWIIFNCCRLGLTLGLGRLHLSLLRLTRLGLIALTTVPGLLLGTRFR